MEHELLDLAACADATDLASGTLELLDVVVDRLGRDYPTVASNRSAIAVSAHGEVLAWSWEVAAWFALVERRYDDVVTYSEAGLRHAGATNAAVHLTLQAGRGYARMGDRRASDALKAGRCARLEHLYPRKRRVAEFAEQLRSESPDQPPAGTGSRRVPLGDALMSACTKTPRTVLNRRGVRVSEEGRVACRRGRPG